MKFLFYFLLGALLFELVSLNFYGVVLLSFLIASLYNSYIPIFVLLVFDIIHAFDLNYFIPMSLLLFIYMKFVHIFKKRFLW